MTALLTPPASPSVAAGLVADQVTLTVIDNYLATTCREMGIAMMRTAYSPMFNESLDFSCVLFDAKGRLIAQAEFCPSQIGTIKFTVEWMLDELGPDVYKPGDVIIMNDPYRGSGHIPEHTLLKAVFHKGEIVGFVANCAHLAEPGAKAPGGLAGDATDIFQEGLRIPPLWLRREGVQQEDIWKIIFANHRTPKVTYGDLMAMVGSLNVAERRLTSLIDTYGYDTVTTATEDLIGIAERRMAEEIRRIPDGEFRFSDIIEDDGVAEGSYVIECSVVVDGGNVTCDFTGSDGEAAGPMNATYAVTASAVYNAFMHITDPTIPRNEGCYRPINIIAPPGTIVNCEFPAPLVGGNTEVSPRITDIIFGALADALPERIPASLGGTSCCFLFGGQHPDSRRSVLALPLRGHRLGRPARRRRQQPGDRHQRQLSQHTGGGLRDPLPAAGGVLPPAGGLRRAGAEPGWSGYRAHPDHGGRGGDRQRHLQPDAGGPLRDPRGQTGRQQRHLRAPGRRRVLEHVQREVRDDVAVEVLQHPPPPRRPGEDRGTRRRRLGRPAGALRRQGGGRCRRGPGDSRGGAARLRPGRNAPQRRLGCHAHDSKGRGVVNRLRRTTPALMRVAAP